MAGVEADPDPGLVGHQVQDLAQLAQVPAHRAALPAQGFGSGFNQVSGSGSRRAKMTHKSRKKSRHFMF